MGLIAQIHDGAFPAALATPPGKPGHSPDAADGSRASPFQTLRIAPKSAAMGRHQAYVQEMLSSPTRPMAPVARPLTGRQHIRVPDDDLRRYLRSLLPPHSYIAPEASRTG
jgi:hypothetical protein